MSSHWATHPDMEYEGKKQYTEIEMGKNPDAKDKRDNLRKAGQNQAKLRLGVHKREYASM